MISISVIFFYLVILYSPEKNKKTLNSLIYFDFTPHKKILTNNIEKDNCNIYKPNYYIYFSVVSLFKEIFVNKVLRDA